MGGEVESEDASVTVRVWGGSLLSVLTFLYL